MKKKSKRYRENLKNIIKDKKVDLKTALELVKKNSTTKFDESIDISLRINLKQSKGGDLSLRTIVKLPNGSGKKSKVAVLCEPDKIEEANTTIETFDTGSDVHEKITTEDTERERNDENMEEFLGSLSKANELNDNDWNTNRILGEANLTLQNFQQSKIYATKAYNANPNHPFVLSIYGDALIRNGEVENGIKVFEKMYEMEPIPAMDSNSDRPLKKLFLAYYLNNDYKKCDEIFNQIEEHDFQDWFIYMHIKTKQNIEYIKDSWYAVSYTHLTLPTSDLV